MKNGLYLCAENNTCFINLSALIPYYACKTLNGMGGGEIATLLKTIKLKRYETS